jgi:uncharacterized membrane protein YhiD involved in acid resistance
MITSFNIDSINVIYLLAAVFTILISVVTFFLKDLHKLLASLNSTVIELNTTVSVVRESNKKEFEMLNNTLKERTIRLQKLENRVDNHAEGITDFYKTFDEKIQNMIDKQSRR